MSETNTLMTNATNNTDGAASSGVTEATTTESANISADTTAAPDTQSSNESTEGKPSTIAPQDSTEGKTDGEQAAGNDPVVPEKYEFKAPEGREFDAQVLEQFSEVAKELKLSQEGAQKVIDKLSSAIAEKQISTMQSAKDEWVKAVNADKEIGGDKLNENLSVAKKALETFGSPELRTLLNDSGLGNHPEMIRAFFKAGQAISEDRMVSGGIGGPGGARDPAKSLYPNQ